MSETREQRWLRLYREAYGKPGVLPNDDSPMWRFASMVEQECLATEEMDLKEAVIDEANSVVQRAGRRPDGTAWANLNINDLASKVAALKAELWSCDESRKTGLRAEKILQEDKSALQAKVEKAREIMGRAWLEEKNGIPAEGFTSQTMKILEEGLAALSPATEVKNGNN